MVEHFLSLQAQIWGLVFISSAGGIPNSPAQLQERRCMPNQFVVVVASCDESAEKDH